MSTPRLFSPRDIRNDMGRFGGSLFYFQDRRGKPTSGLKSLVGIQHRRWDEDARNIRHDPVWSSSLLTLVYRNLSNDGQGEMVELKGTALKGLDLNFTPAWTHKGYTMYNRQGSERPYMCWLSLASNRQYRWGLSTRAFEMRGTRGWPSTLNTDGPPGWLLASVWENGSLYVAPQDIDLRLGGQALTPQLAVHRITDTEGALVHNARTVVGFYHNNALLVEHQAKRLTTSLKDSVDYVPTATLTRLYTTDILPSSMRPRQLAEPDDVEQPSEGLQFSGASLERLRGLSPTRSWFEANETVNQARPDFWQTPPEPPESSS